MAPVVLLFTHSVFLEWTMKYRNWIYFQPCGVELIQKERSIMVRDHCWPSLSFYNMTGNNIWTLISHSINYILYEYDHVTSLKYSSSSKKCAPRDSNRNMNYFLLRLVENVSRLCSTTPNAHVVLRTGGKWVFQFCHIATQPHQWGNC